MRDRDRIIVMLGDLAAFVAFGAIGMVSHGDPLTAKSVARAIVLFPAAWFLIAPWCGAFSQCAVAGQGGSDPLGLARIALVWLLAGVIALVARAALFDRALFNAFFVVALVGYGLFPSSPGGRFTGVGWRPLLVALLVEVDLEAGDLASSVGVGVVRYG